MCPFNFCLSSSWKFFQIQNIPASFDPNSAEIKLRYIKPEDKTIISLQQTVTSLPDRKNVNQLIEREKSAAQNIISHSIDFTREMRENISDICEASSYRTYSDMNGIFDFIINYFFDLLSRKIISLLEILNISKF